MGLLKLSFVAIVDFVPGELPTNAVATMFTALKNGMESPRPVSACLCRNQLTNYTALEIF